ncbi:hypothetical protein [Vallitalea sp.]|uniref:hypothetical protein n=1 Tax=Vallitalea sp. TaxID=1882829 RepID=UPI0025F1328E|nr:hypothetical protein [Vallitalea sp.]
MVDFFCTNIKNRGRSVVYSDVPDYALMIGVPARQKGWVFECGEQLEENLICKKCQRFYKIINDGIKQVKQYDTNE